MDNHSANALNDNCPLRPPNCVLSMRRADEVLAFAIAREISLYKAAKASLSSLSRAWFEYLVWLRGLAPLVNELDA